MNLIRTIPLLGAQRSWEGYRRGLVLPQESISLKKSPSDLEILLSYDRAHTVYASNRAVTIRSPNIAATARLQMSTCMVVLLRYTPAHSESAPTVTATMQAHHLRFVPKFDTTELRLEESTDRPRYVKRRRG